MNSRSNLEGEQFQSRGNLKGLHNVGFVATGSVLHDLCLGHVMFLYCLFSRFEQKYAIITIKLFLPIKFLISRTSVAYKLVGI